jgi:hypothetical protein
VQTKFKPNPPATEEAISELANRIGRPLPMVYLDAMRIANGGVGFIGARHVHLWKVEELIERNKRYEVARYAPSLFLFGSNGGGEAYAFNLTKSDEVVYEVPFIGLDVKEALPIAKSFSAFVPSANLVHQKIVT